MADEAKDTAASQSKGSKQQKGRPRSYGEPEHEDYVTGDEALEKGFTGAREKRDDRYDNDEFALTSGPDSPPYPLDEDKHQ